MLPDTPARWALFILLAEGLLALLACGGSSGHSSPADAGHDSSASHASEGGTGRGDGGAGRVPDGSARRVPDGSRGHEPIDAGAIVDVGTSPGVLDYCEVTLSATLRCGLLSHACLEAELDGGSFDAAVARYVGECASAYSHLVSSAYAGAYSACFPSIPCCLLQGTCEDAGLAISQKVDECIASKLEGVPPDPADEKVRADFCKTCPDLDGGLPACAGFFSFDEAGVRDGGIPDGWATSAAAFGFGSFLYGTTDPIVQQIDQTCTGPALAKFDGGSQLGNACYGKFVGCAQSVETAAAKPFEPTTDAQAPAACRPDGG